MTKKLERYTSGKDFHPELCNLFHGSSLRRKYFETADGNPWHSVRVYNFDFKKERINLKHETHKNPEPSGKKYFETVLDYSARCDKEQLERIRGILVDRLGMELVE